MTNTITRRELVRVAGVSGGLGVLGVGHFKLASDASAQPAAGSPALVGIEPSTIRRRGVGFRGYDPARAFIGYTLIAPNTQPSSANAQKPYGPISQPYGKTIYLIDMLGNVVHRWEMPYSPGLTAYLTDRGTLFLNGHVPSTSNLGQKYYRGGAAMEVNWNGRVLWEVNHPDHHHDGIRLRNGNVLLICMKPLQAEIVRKVRGGRPGSEYDNGKMDSDYLVEMTTDGKVLWEWRSWEHLDPDKDGITAVEDDRDVWPVANSVSEMPDGNILVSFRTNSTVVMINRQTGAIYWKLGAPPLSGQHAPYILSNGNTLLFDNGPHRLDHTFPYSRVLEINPATKEIVWKYQDTPEWSFYSPRISNAQRLPNGNTLICEGFFGRLFEVTREGDTVWEYVNPYFVGPLNRVARAFRYSDLEIARARAAT
jgi:Arylsulfotransferase (ASST)